MDSNQKKSLSSEELAAVDKAMAEFGKSSWKQEMVTPKKQKRPKVRMPVRKFSPLVRTILLAAIPVILAVAVLVFVFGGGTNEPSPTAPTTTPETTLPSVIIVRPTDGTEQPTEVPVPPDTQPSEPTESTPPYTPPTEPPVVIPEGTPLTEDELAIL